MCDEVRLVLSAQLDGEAAGSDPAPVAAHLADCPDCRQWRADAQELAGSGALAEVLRLRSTGAPDLTEQIMAAVARDAATTAPAGAEPTRTGRVGSAWAALTGAGPRYRAR